MNDAGVIVGENVTVGRVSQNDAAASFLLSVRVAGHGLHAGAEATTVHRDVARSRERLTRTSV